MDLNHSFTVPASVAETWETFEDIESVAGLLPGCRRSPRSTATTSRAPARSSSVRSRWSTPAPARSSRRTRRPGQFVDRGQGQGQARQRHRRRQGHRHASPRRVPDSTRVDVDTDLAITGKPAQFGRGRHRGHLQQAAPAVRRLPAGQGRRRERRQEPAAASPRRRRRRRDRLPQPPPAGTRAAGRRTAAVAGFVAGRPRAAAGARTTRSTSARRCCRSWPRPTGRRSARGCWRC